MKTNGPTILTELQWNTLVSWTECSFTVNNKLIEVNFIDSRESAIRIDMTDITAISSKRYQTSYFTVYKDGINEQIIPHVIATILRRIWDEKELEKCKNDVEYFQKKYTTTQFQK
jgi:hypothetical protein